MKKALQNPVVVGVLAVVAVIIVYRSVLKRPSYTVPAAGIQTRIDPGERVAAPGGVLPSENMVDTAGIQWITSFDRDPFDSEWDAESQSDDHDSPDEVSNRDLGTELMLSAIWSENERPLAVVNGKVVGKGERILDYQVESILADQIIVHGSGGRTVIGFSSQSNELPKRPQTAAKGNNNTLRTYKRDE